MMKRSSAVGFALLAGLVFGGDAARAAEDDYFAYVGTYTKDKSKGIYVYRFQAGDGKLTPLGLAAETSSPSFLAVHPSRRFLYAVNEERGGSVSAFALDPKTGKLTFLNTVSSRGGGPCYVAVDKSGKSVLVANYGGGSVAALPIGEDGKLREASASVQHAAPPAKPHAHSINLSPDNRFAIAADLGLDQVLVYRFDAVKGSLTAHDPPFAKVPTGSGPRHFAFHPNGKFGYVINELGNTMIVFAWDAGKGTLNQVQSISTLPQDFTGKSYTAEVQVHPSGRFVYGSNRGHDSIVVFAVDGAKGTLTPIEHVPTQGKFPRNFTVDPTGRYLFAANQNTDNIVVFRIDQKTGRLTPTGQVLEHGAPVCVKFVAAE